MLSVSKIRNLSLIPPENEHEFENLCLALWKRILRDPNFQFVGRRGQSQGGVDLIGRRDGTLNWIGIQCKVRTGGILAKNDVRKDVKNAKDFNPRLSELVFATTARRDQKLQEFDIWVTPSLGEISDSAKFKDELSKVIRMFDVLEEATNIIEKSYPALFN